MGTEPFSVTRPSDSFDWRDGLVVRDPSHVYGATALTAQEWERRDSQRHGVLVLEERTVHTREQLMRAEFEDRRSAYSELHHRIEMSPGAFGALRGPIRIVLTEVWS